MTSSLDGGCLCRHVRYELRTESREAYYCHCRMCQLAFGNLFAAFVTIKKTELTWMTNPPAVHASSRFAERGFCPRCGTPLTFAFLDSAKIDVSVGSLDQPEVMRPVKHVGVESQIAAWHKPDDLPAHRTEDNEDVMRRWRETYGENAEPGLKTVFTRTR